jgi:hypothetical protein
MKKYKLDEWVLYSPFPNAHSEILKNQRIRSVILEVLKDDWIYDYRIYIDDGDGKVKKVKESELFPEETKY